MTTTDTTDAAKLKAVIAAAVDASSGRPRDHRVDAITTAAQEHFATVLPGLIQAAVNSPETAAALAQGVLVPFLREAEDQLNDAHDAAATTERDRPGLRRAVRIIRDLRRELEKGDDQ